MHIIYLSKYSDLNLKAKEHCMPGCLHTGGPILNQFEVLMVLEQVRWPNPCFDSELAIRMLNKRLIFPKIFMGNEMYFSNFLSILQHACNKLIYK
jgi:hypothetical protein